jgi:hypothetical protein
MTFFFSFLFIFILAALLTLISVYIELSEIFDFHSLFSSESSYFYILFIRFVHYFITIKICFFIFIFDKKYDMYYVIYFCLLLLHWILFDECFLSKIEHEYSATYKGEETGTKKTNLIHPHLDILFKENTDWFILFQAIMMTVNITYILIFRFTPSSFDILSKTPFGRSPVFHTNFPSLRSGESLKYRILFTTVLIGTMSYLMLKDRIFRHVLLYDNI